MPRSPDQQLRAPGPLEARRRGRLAFWAVAYSFLVTTAFSTAPSPLYGLYERREGLSSLTITIIARVLTGIALGGTVATATAYLTDLDTEAGAPLSRRSQIVATVANVGGLAIGPLLAGTLHHPSSALAGATIFLTFGSGVVVQTTTTTWPLHRLLTWGIITTLAGLAVIVTAAWVSPPSLASFLIGGGGGAVVGAGGGGIFRGTLTMIGSTATADQRASALATFFVAGYVGLSLPVVALGIALQHFSAKVTLLAFGLVVGAGTFAAAPVLVGHRRPSPASQRA
jgi:MFS family permease